MKHFFATLAAFVLLSTTALCQMSDAALRRAVSNDAAARNASGALPTLSADEHLARAEAYSTNRMFPQAREHWQKVLDNYPNDPGISKAMFGTARSYMWERQYEKAVFWFNKLTSGHLNTKDGREGLAFTGASLVRLGRNLEAVEAYEKYTATFPEGERIESAHLNIIDAYREAGRYDDANRWVDKTVASFAGKAAEINAMHARLRMEIFRENWNAANSAANRLLERGRFAGTMASADEVKFLKAFAMERSGKKAEANSIYASITNTTYFGGLAAEKRKLSTSRLSAAAEYPVMYRVELLQTAKKYKVDPRFILAIMKQESSFKPAAKSPAGARGLLQLVYDTALKYNKQAGFPNLQPDDLYTPATNIAVGGAYLGALKSEFGGLYEAIAASYNGGEDNAARWLARSRPKEPGIFASEVGFAESKNYVFKVMNNYRAYRELYTEDLNRR